MSKDPGSKNESGGRIQGGNGFIVLESDDPAAIYTWAAEWHDVCEFNITPVVDDEQAAVVLQNSRQG